MMVDRDQSLEVIGSWQTRALVVGGILGALVGAGAAYLLIQKSESEGKPPSISPGEGVRLGLLVLGLLRQVATIGEEK